MIVAAPALLFVYSAMQAITSGQSNEEALSRKTVKYPTMLDMTFPEFEAAGKGTDIVLLPIGAIEEHSSHLPLGTAVLVFGLFRADRHSVRFAMLSRPSDGIENSACLALNSSAKLARSVFVM